MLILLLIQHELSYDLHHQDLDRLYRVAGESGMPDGDITRSAATPPPIAWNMKKDFPEIEQVTRILGQFWTSKDIFSYGDNQFFETRGYYADSTFFQMFSYNFLHGDPNTALNEPNSMVISQKIAQKLFRETNPLGKTIKITNNSGENSYKITGVLSDQQQNSHINVNYLMSFNTKGGMAEYAYTNDEWLGNNFLHTYIKLKPNTSAAQLEEKFPDFVKFHAGERIEESGRTKAFFLQAVKDIHIYSNLNAEISINSSINYIYILSAISFLVLLIACINFMNLSTARSGKRAKEVGLRKVLGAYKSQLVKQFLGESMLITVLAFVIAMALVEISLPLFENLVNQELNESLFTQPLYLIYLLGLTVFTGFLAGCYPAFYLSAFQPVKVLKGKLGNRYAAGFLRKGLVVFQFSIAIALIAGAILIVQQLHFIQNKDLGFRKDQKLIIPLHTQKVQQDYEILKNKYLQNPKVTSFTGSTTYPGKPVFHDWIFHVLGKNEKDGIVMKMNFADYDFLKTTGIQLLKGRFFSDQFGAEEDKVVVNETALKNFGLSLDEAIGTKIKAQNDDETLEVIGVVKDFNYSSLHSPIEPYIFVVSEEINFPYVLMSFNTHDISGFLNEVKNTWDTTIQNIPFEYSFLDQELVMLYEAEQKFAWVIQTFTGIAILITCLGLFGLASFITEQRQKEIGIRKVLGASALNVVQLVSKDFMILIVIASVIAFPLAYYFMNLWLQDFNYRISINGLVFLISALIAVIIAMITISSMAYRAAILNPVEVLKDE